MPLAKQYTWENVADYLGLPVEDTKNIFLSQDINDYCAASHVRRTIQILDGISYVDVEDMDGIGRNTVRRSIRQAISSAMAVLCEKENRRCGSFYD